MKELLIITIAGGVAYLIFKKMKAKADALKIEMQKKIDEAKNSVKTEIKTITETKMVYPDPNIDNWHS